MFKKSILVILVLVLAFSLVVATGCGQKATESKDQEPAEPKDKEANVDGKSEIDFPQKPITFLVGWGAGGGSDQVARTLAPLAEKELGQPIVVVNKKGGSGAVAYTELSQSKPDGYTIAIATSTISTHKPLGNLNLGSEDFEAIIGVNYDPGGLHVKADAPWDTLDEFIEYAKEHPGEITIAASNPGSITRFECIKIMQETGVEFNVVPNPGGAGPGLVQLAGGHVDAAMGTPLESAALREAGKIKSLGFMSEERVEAAPDIPTFKEQGYDIVLQTARVILAPKGTPRPILEKLHDAFSAAVESKEYQNFIKNKGSNAMNLSIEETREFLNKQDKIFAEIIEKMNLK